MLAFCVAAVGRRRIHDTRLPGREIACMSLHPAYQVPEEHSDFIDCDRGNLPDMEITSRGSCLSIKFCTLLVPYNHSQDYLVNRIL